MPIKDSLEVITLLSRSNEWSLEIVVFILQFLFLSSCSGFSPFAYSSPRVSSALLIRLFDTWETLIVLLRRYKREKRREKDKGGKKVTGSIKAHIVGTL